MELTVLTKPEELSAIREDWSTLMKTAYKKGVYLSYEWCWASYQSFARNDQMYVLVLRDDGGKLSGVAPLVLTSRLYRGIRVKTVGFVRNDQNPANDFLVSRGSEEVCFRMFLKHLCTFLNWEFIDLHLVDNEGPSGKFLQRVLLETGCRYGTKSNRQSPYILLDLSWDDFWKSKSQRFKKSIRNKLNRAGKQEDLVVEKLPITGDSPAFEDMLRISSNSWKQKIGTDLSGREDNREFIKRVSELLGPRGLVHVWFLKVDKVAVAYELHFEYENVAYPIRADYDESYKGISPGSILEHEIIRTLFQKKEIREYHSCGHTYDYLLKWTDKVKDHQNFEIFNDSVKMRLLHCFEYRVMVLLRKSEAFEKVKLLINHIKARTQ